MIELLGRNDADVGNPRSVRRLVLGGLSNGRHREKRGKYDGECFHPKDPFVGRVCSYYSLSPPLRYAPAFSRVRSSIREAMAITPLVTVAVGNREKRIAATWP